MLAASSISHGKTSAYLPVIELLNSYLFLLLRDSSSVSAAERSFRTAIEVARKQEAKSLELRATASLARLLDRQGKRDEARTMLSDIYGWFTEGLDTADLKDAQALLDKLGT